MAIFQRRKQSIFDVREAPLDPEELTLRFRRRVVKISFAIAVCILIYPIILQQMPLFRMAFEARKFARALLEMRKQAAAMRMPGAISLLDEQTWSLMEFPGAENCDTALAQAPQKLLEQKFSRWRILFLEQNNTTNLGVEAKQICFHPTRGVLVDSKPLDQGWLYLVAYPIDFHSDSPNYIRQIVLTNSGQDIELQKLLEPNIE